LCTRPDLYDRKKGTLIYQAQGILDEPSAINQTSLIKRHADKEKFKHEYASNIFEFLKDNYTT
jgi:hypothetical protein